MLSLSEHCRCLSHCMTAGIMVSVGSVFGTRRTGRQCRVIPISGNSMPYCENEATGLVVVLLQFLTLLLSPFFALLHHSRCIISLLLFPAPPSLSLSVSFVCFSAILPSCPPHGSICISPFLCLPSKSTTSANTPVQGRHRCSWPRGHPSPVCRSKARGSYSRASSVSPTSPMQACWWTSPRWAVEEVVQVSHSNSTAISKGQARTWWAAQSWATPP